ncbi:sulfite exporter TauE/SafE family protein [Schlegelella aquatica]|uniref:sulfite exporter TauE/SafE family protein n=1 Tax=Caldimonas aquatica TaxID=376175 RepID=UPI0037530D4B
MVSGLVFTALLMGLAGSPHCVAMCGAATAGVGCTRPRLLSFQLGRLAGYATLGALVATSAGALQWGAEHSAWLRPFWALFHVAVLALGIALVWRGRQPAWLEGLAHRVWQEMRHRTLGWSSLQVPFAAGLLWVLLPCGLLYSALMVAALAPGAGQGALVMAAFAFGSALGLQVGPMLWQRFGARAGGGTLAVRLAGGFLLASSAWALGHGVWSKVAAGVC